MPPPTRPERALYAALTKAGVRYSAQQWIGRYRPDAVLLGAAVVIEVDGRYWHSKPKQQRKDRRKDQYYAARGLQVLRVWDDDLLRDPDAWVARISEALRAATG